MSGRIFFSVHRTVLFPPSPQEKSGEKRRGRGRKMKKGKVEKKPPDILSAREKRMGGKNKVLENRKIFYFPVR